MLYSYLFVAAGGAVGAMARFALNSSFQRGVGDPGIEYPTATLMANLLGCLAMGVIAQLIASTSWFNASGIVPDQYRLLFAVGFCGSFTTLSSLVFEVNSMLQRNEVFSSFSYLVVTLVGGFACFYVGVVCIRLFVGILR